MPKNLAVISVIGHDQKGVVARISTYLAGCNINIEDIEQRVVEGLFIMTMLVDLRDLSINLDELILGLKRIGEEIHMDVSIRLHGRKEPKRVAVLVSESPLSGAADRRARARHAERRVGRRAVQSRGAPPVGGRPQHPVLLVSRRPTRRP